MKSKILRTGYFRDLSDPPSLLLPGTKPLAMTLWCTRFLYLSGVTIRSGDQNPTERTSLFMLARNPQPTDPLALGNGQGADADLLAIEVVRSLAAAESDWRALETAQNACIYQHFDWVHAWCTEIGAHLGIEAAVVIGRRAGRIVFVWPFGIRRQGPLRIAEWLGDRNANYNVGLYAPGEQDRLSPAEVRSLLSTLAAECRIDLFHFERQPATWAGLPNPLVAALPSVPSPSNGYACTLAPTFDELLDRYPGSQRRKRFRKRERKFEEAGDYTIVESDPEPSPPPALEAYFQQKAQRFAELGIRNCFADPKVRAFYTRLAATRQEGCPPLVSFWSLRAGGIHRAVAGIAAAGGLRYVLFLSFANDEMATHSPGSVLVYKIVEQSCQSGFTAVDFGVGEEFYKEQWCDQTIALFETIYPVTLIGRIYETVTRVKTTAKRAVKQNPQAWDLFKRLRRLRAARS